MTPERWDRLKVLFEAALEVPPAGRAAFVAVLCAGDEETRSELERLLAAEQEVKGFLSGSTHTFLAPEEPSPAFVPGSVLAGRFRISRFLGKGGMGEVYEAWDADLRQAVALKTLRPEISRDPRSGERLLKEIQNGRRVTHRNVCRTFDLARHHAPDGEFLLLTMELVAGETLSARLKTAGPLPPSEALDLARQMAEGLEAAHREGIVHRDFKAGNVMIAPTQGGVRVVVTDFGLAQTSERSDQDVSLTIPGAIVGTPAYMAPEQLSGEEATFASDIYSFGVVLCEMVTGQRPPAGRKLLKDDPKFGAWAAAISRCLDSDPSRRFTSALEAVRAIEGLAPPVRNREPRRLWPGGRTVWIASGIFLLASLFAILRLYLQRPPAPDGSHVMLADVTNSTGDHDLDAMTELFRTQLAQSAYFTLWDRNRLPGVLQAMAKPSREKLDGTLAREVALRENVPFIVFANVGPLGDQFVVNVRLEYLESGSIFSRDRWSHTVQAGGKSDISGAVHESCLWLRRTIGESGRDLAARDRLPEDVTTGSWEAWRAYARAETFQAEGQSEVATQVLKEAVALDPHFALAYMRLGDILMSISRQEEALRYWRVAEEEANRVHLTRREELRVRGLYAGDTWDWSEYESAFAQMEREYPHDYLASFYLADALCQQGNFAGCAAKFQEAARKSPGSVPAADNLGVAFLLVGNADKVESQARELDRLGRSDLATRLRGVARFSGGDFKGALDFFQTQTGSVQPYSRSRGYWLQAAALAEMGQLRMAEATLTNGIEDDSKLGLVDQRASKLVSIGYLRLRQGDVIGARQNALSGAAESGSPGLLLQAATLLAQAGEPLEAKKLVSRISNIAAGTQMATIAARLVEAEILLQQHQPQKAAAVFTSCARIDSALRLKAGLARALLASGSPQDALAVYNRTDTPAWVYLGPEKIFPGQFTDLLLEKANCAIAAQRWDEARAGLTEYLKRRASADAGLAEVDKARLSLQRISTGKY